MGQVYFENIPPLVKASSTTCTLAATHLGQPTRIQIGGQAYKLSSTLTLNTATTGLGGLDTGALGAIQLWYVYACANTSGVVGLVASLTGPSTGPSGFSGRYNLIGAFYSDGSSLIGSTVTITGEAVSGTFNLNPEQRGSSNGQPFTNIIFSRAHGWRKGESLHVSIFVTFTGTPATGTGALQFLISTLQIDTTKIEIIPNVKNPSLIYNASTGANYTLLSDVANSGGFIVYSFVNVDGQAGLNTSFQPAAGSPVAITANHRVQLESVIPISGWNSTLLG